MHRTVIGLCSVLLLAHRATAGEPPKLPVTRPLSQLVSDTEDFTARLAPVSQVEIRARVTGYLQKVLFKEGSDVQKGQVLFEIDPAPYRAGLEKARAKLALAKAKLLRRDAQYQRLRDLFAKKAARQDQLDEAVADRAEAKAAVQLAEAEVKIAQLTLESTQVRAPLSGRVGRGLDVGNLVKADDTPLTTLVTLDPMYAYFDLDEQTLLRLRRFALKDKGNGELPVHMGLADEKGVPHRGKIHFVENSLEPKTGTLRVRAVFPNKDGLLLPGLFARIRLTLGQPYKALLVPDKSVFSDKSNRYVYVVNAKNVVERRSVKLGARHGSLRVVLAGLKEEDRVAVAIVQGVRPGVTVQPKQVPLRGPEAPSTGKEPHQQGEGRGPAASSEAPMIPVCVNDEFGPLRVAVVPDGANATDLSLDGSPKAERGGPRWWQGPCDPFGPRPV
jgi:RND family efflux transporter MFP subunit